MRSLHSPVRAEEIKQKTRETAYLTVVLAVLPAQTSGERSIRAHPRKSLSHAIHAVNDLDTTLAFYRNVFGINGRAQGIFPTPPCPCSPTHPA